MPAFENCPEDAYRYIRDFEDYWKDAVRHIYGVVVQAIGLTINPKDKVRLIKDVKVKSPVEFDDKNDFNMAKRHAFGDATDVVKKYFIDQIQKGYLPSLNDVLSNVRAEPKYVSS